MTSAKRVKNSYEILRSTVVLNIGFGRIRKQVRVKKQWWKDFLEQLYREETEKRQ